MKKLLITLISVVSMFSAHATIFTTNNLAATNATMINEPIIGKSITLFTTNATTTLVRLFDGATTREQAAWTNYVLAVTNVVTTYTNTTGTTNTFTNAVLKSFASIHDAETVNIDPIAVIAVPPNGETITLDLEGLIFSQYLALSNNLKGVSAIITYRTP